MGILPLITLRVVARTSRVVRENHKTPRHRKGTHMPKRTPRLAIGYYRTKDHDELEEALQDVIDAVENHYNSVLGCPDRNEANFIAALHAAGRITKAILGLYVVQTISFDDPEAQAKECERAEEEARRPYPPQFP